MLFTPLGANTYGANQFSWGTTRPSNTNGTSVTPVTTNAYSAYVALGASALSFDSYGILININSNTTTNASRRSAIKIGVDLAGGTSYTDVITQLVAGDAAQYYLGGSNYFFPLYIPAGATVAVAARGSVGTAFFVNATYFQKPVNPSVIRKGAYVETLGVTVGTGTVNGTSITPGTTNEGSWTLIGQTTQRLWWWQLGLQINDASKSNSSVFLDLGVGDTNVVGDPKDIIIGNFLIGVNTSDSIINLPLTAGVEYNVPDGKFLFVRAQNSVANDAAYDVAVYGCGG